MLDYPSTNLSFSIDPHPPSHISPISISSHRENTTLAVISLAHNEMDSAGVGNIMLQLERSSSIVDVDLSYSITNTSLMAEGWIDGTRVIGREDGARVLRRG